MTRPPLVRQRNTIIGGVCAGLADHLGLPVAITRAIMLALIVLGGAGGLLYLWLWALVPLAPPPLSAAAYDGPPTGRAAADAHATADAAAASVHRSAPVAALLAAVAAIAAAFAVLVAIRSDSAGSAAATALLAATVLSGASVAWSLTLDRADSGRTTAYGISVRVVAAAVLLLAGSAVLLTGPTATTAVIAVAMVVLGVGVVAAPWVVTLWTDLMAERTARVREVQRAEIAAHLHDSVLQTLALIQNRAGASSEVARIARAQERELRDWLFVGDAPVTADLAAELRDVAAAIELDYPVRIEVVTAGESVGPSNPALGSAALVAAAREAMLNAARHAGGDVSVYVEFAPTAVDVFVRDRGPGVDLAGLPDDRLGIRESIIGRMTRAGGTATVRPAAGTPTGTGPGTEVHLHLEVAP